MKSGERFFKSRMHPLTLLFSFFLFFLSPPLLSIFLGVLVFVVLVMVGVSFIEHNAVIFLFHRALFISSTGTMKWQVAALIDSAKRCLVMFPQKLDHI